MLESLYTEHLIDYVAMDIKSSPLDYSHITGAANLDMSSIYDSVEFLMHSGIDYEFRTTVVKEFHNAETFEQIGNWIGGCKAYFLQNFKNSNNVIRQGYHSRTKEELASYVSLLQKHIETVSLRGVD